MPITNLLATNEMVKSLFATIPNLKDLWTGMDSQEPFPSKPTIIVQRECRATPIIGHAYDYMLRAYVQRLNGSHQEHSESDLAASIAVHLLDQKHIHKAYEGILERRNAYITGTLQLTIDIIKDAVVLGQLEQFYRSGSGEIATILQANEENIQDLQALIEATYEHANIFTNTQGVICNPRFGEAVTALVDGADGDLIIDNSLIDIKTESKFRWKIGQSRQLIAYWILTCLSPGFIPQIRRLAIWNPRYCRLVSIGVEDICRTINMVQFVDSFISIIIADGFEGSNHLKLEQRQQYIHAVREAWSDTGNPIRQYYK